MTMQDRDDEVGHPDAEEIIRIVCRHCIGVSEAEVRQIVLSTLKLSRGDGAPTGTENDEG